jgi:hypothetical protein
MPALHLPEVEFRPLEWSRPLEVVLVLLPDPILEGIDVPEDPRLLPQDELLMSVRATGVVGS